MVSMRTRRSQKPEYQIKIAKERILILFDEAAKAATDEPQLAQRHVQRAKKIGMRYNVRLGALRKRFCRHCFAYFTGTNARRRLVRGMLKIKCLSCNRTMSVPYKGARS